MYLDKELKKMVKVQENAYDPEVFFKTVDGVLKSMEELKSVYKILDYGLCSMRGIMLTKEQLEDWKRRHLYGCALMQPPKRLTPPSGLLQDLRGRSFRYDGNGELSGRLDTRRGVVSVCKRRVKRGVYEETKPAPPSDGTRQRTRFL